MAVSITRLTLFALISSLEEDLRDLVSQSSNRSELSPTFVSDELADKVAKRAKREKHDVGENLGLEESLILLDLGDLVALAFKNKRNLDKSELDGLTKINSQVEALVRVRNRVMHSRPLDYEDFPRVLDLCAELAQDHPAVWNEVNTTLVRIKEEPFFVQSTTFSISASESDKIFHNLPLPDFDETGFIGRADLVNDLVKYCLGPYPVVTIVGEGGIGKSATALKVAYELLDKEEAPFDAIVWVSSKSSFLTPTEIVQIDDAITDSLGVFKSTANILGDPSSIDPVEEILDYMREFHILLILDNLENVLDSRLVEFLKRLPKGNKILITSRIGIGSLELPVKLGPFKEKESIRLMRALARTRQVEQILNLNDQRLSGFSHQLNHNPGFIKWFVSAVQAGKRPEEVIQNTGIFLEYCVSNVYEHLDSISVEIMKSLVSVPGDKTLAQIAFLIGKSAIETQRAVQRLTMSYLLDPILRSVGSTTETSYEVPQLAREFLRKHKKISKEEIEVFVKRNNQLVATGEQIQMQATQNRYSFDFVDIRSKQDYLVAKLLRDAMQLEKKGLAVEADTKVEECKRLSPSYYEVYRVEALLKYFRKDFLGARDCYEIAMRLEPNSASLRFFFGSFLLRAYDDQNSALEHFAHAKKLDSSAHIASAEIARIKLYQGRFDEANDMIQNLLTKTSLTEKTRRIVYDLSYQIYMRHADNLQLQDDYVGALEQLEMMRSAFQRIPPFVADNRHFKSLAKSIPTAIGCEKRIAEMSSDLGLRERIHSISRWIRITTDTGLTVEAVSSSGKKKGWILSLYEGFGFIKNQRGESIFFPFSSLRKGNNKESLAVDTPVLYSEGANHKGQCAIDVEIE